MIQFELSVSGKSIGELERKALEAADKHPESVARAVAKTAQVIRIKS